MQSPIKCAAVGDGGVGKGSLFFTFRCKQFPDVYFPAAWRGAHYAEVDLDGKTVELNLEETNGQEDYDRLRPLIYPYMDVLLICFALDCPTSFENVSAKWCPEVRNHCPEVPILLIGTKLDLRDCSETIEGLKEDDLSPITYAQGQALAQQIGAVKYVECSAKTQQNLQEIFEEVVRAAWKRRHKMLKKNHNCSLL
ncbi:hypothetical protein NDU88_005491 [Pleurodeles waltl]|uniref:Uncharacterized protein n=1 Tax=Pleurodeles waltl TaxID=8319 RepID=A0AAV7TAL0_PLEWA|nr:hypothetical protein NDU88_005491 [Pleurodeles waltl]